MSVLIIDRPIYTKYTETLGDYTKVVWLPGEILVWFLLPYYSAFVHVKCVLFCPLHVGQGPGHLLNQWINLYLLFSNVYMSLFCYISHPYPSWRFNLIHSIYPKTKYSESFDMHRSMTVIDTCPRNQTFGVIWYIQIGQRCLYSLSWVNLTYK